MKRYIKKYQKYISIHHYISVAKQQPAHIQRVYAATFAGIVTGLVAVAILYFDYGFWHERYSRTEQLTTSSVLTKTVDEDMVTVQSPGEMIGDFFKEASTKLQTIKVTRPDMLEGKEVYTKEEMSE